MSLTIEQINDIANKTINFYLVEKFSDIFSCDVIKEMPIEQAKIINEFLGIANLNNFIFADNLEQFNLAVKIYNEHINSLEDFLLISISEDTLNEINRIVNFYTNTLKSLETDQNYIDHLRHKINLLLQENQQYRVTGYLHYFMSILEIKNSLESSLKDVRVLNSYEFSKLDSNQWFECKSNDISRILGAKYLKNNFDENGITSLAVPEFIVVVENHYINNSLKIKIHLNSSFPMATSILNAKIYSRKIIGNPVANQYRRSTTLGNCSYVDLVGDNGNIIRDNLNIAYVVDTETNSFDMQIKTNCTEFTSPFACHEFLLFTKYYFWAKNSIESRKYCELDITI